MKTFLRLIRDTLVFLWRYPLSLLALQAFDLISEVLLLTVEPTGRLETMVFVALLFPLTWFLSGVSIAATYVFLRASRLEQKPSVGSSYRAVTAHLRDLLPTMLLVGLGVLLGLLVILPGLYFIAIYLFVPCLVMQLPSSSPFVYLAESQHIARKALWPLLTLALFLMVLGLGLEDFTQRLVSLLTMPPVNGDAASFIAKPFISLLASATMSVFIVLCFFHLTEKESCPAPSPKPSTK